MSPDTLADYANELARPGYDYWQGYPSAIGLFCRYLLDEGIELGDARPKAVFLSSETVLDSQRETISEATGAPVADLYANAELTVSAVQCPEGSYHVDSEFCVLEIDPQEETDEWVRGEVISTGLVDRAMPLIRYRTGDIATLRKNVRCGCGRARPLLERIDGRIEDYVVTPDGRRVGRLDHIFKDALQVKEAQIIQEDPRQLRVRIVPRRGFGELERRGLEEAIHSVLGDQIEILIESVDSIPRDATGKFRAVISRLAVGQLR
jgi:phenylacetate-CoA ligase